ncbi:MAG: anthranilate synthase component I family protein [Chitinophagales bacterium]|nr:anthranilate synthase component I family protein [Chitinophagaceae bacterium]MCB9064753.1 anthranilate synthase component I family protein [Chitinophagales bacterium]
MLNRSERFGIFLLLDSNNYSDKYSRFECLVAMGMVGEPIDAAAGLEGLKGHHIANKDWLFGHINYDYKNRLEPKLSSTHPDKVGFPEFFFFCPQTVCYVNKEKTELHIECFDSSPDEVYNDILADGKKDVVVDEIQLSFNHRVSKEDYLGVIDDLREHIRNGDCYEINYCTEGYVEGVTLTPKHVYNSLVNISHAPFAAYYKNSDRYMMCASPERYIRKDGNEVIAQPIKGTIKRGVDSNEDEQLKTQLRESIKDRAENVMITDLLRNDLARSCKTGIITVDELFGIYTFPQVHQMISTVRGALRDDVHFADVIKYSFPMGSMTGAPKVKVMQLIEQYEVSARGLFSGTVGYITPDGDFDFNVIIRSLFYNAADKYLSYQTGGAITYDSAAESEWEEMRLKAWVLEQIFT